VVTHIHKRIAARAGNRNFAVLASLVVGFRLDQEMVWIEASCVAAQMADVLSLSWESAKPDEGRENMQTDFHLTLVVLNGRLRVTSDLCWNNARKQARALADGIVFAALKASAKLLMALEQQDLRRRNWWHSSIAHRETDLQICSPRATTSPVGPSLTVGI
jgi:hypothetical protein